MGDPNATDIPAAAAAERTSLFRAVEALEPDDKDKSYLYGDHLRYDWGCQMVSWLHLHSSMQHEPVGPPFPTTYQKPQRGTRKEWALESMI